MGRRLTPEEKILRQTSAPKVGAVVAYGSRADGYKIGRVISVDVEMDDPQDPRVLLTLANRPGFSTWLVYWEPFETTIVPTLSME